MPATMRGLRGAGAVDGHVAEGGERRHPGGLHGRDDRGEDGDAEAEHQGGDDGGRS